jgi:hypothetical protein
MLGCVGLAYAKSQRQAVVQSGVRQVKITAAIERVDQLLVCCVSGFQPEAHQVQRRWSCELKTSIVCYPRSKLLR